MHSCIDSFTYACISMCDAGQAAETNEKEKGKRARPLYVTLGPL